MRVHIRIDHELPEVIKHLGFRRSLSVWITVEVMTAVIVILTGLCLLPRFDLSTWTVAALWITGLGVAGGLIYGLVSDSFLVWWVRLRFKYEVWFDSRPQNQPPQDRSRHLTSV